MNQPPDIPRSTALSAIFLGNLVFFWPCLFTSEPLTVGAASGDLSIFFKPMRELAAAQWAKGIFPFWNPFSSGGHPFIADPESGMFYPFTYLFAVLPSHLAFSWIYFIHYLICGYGLFFLCRRFRISCAGSLAAVFIYLFSAPHVLHLYAGHFTMITTLAWTPWLFWSLERFLATRSWRHAAGFGLFLGLHLLGGFPQYTYMIGWAALAYGLYAVGSQKLFADSGKIVFRLGCGLVLGTGLFLTQAGLAKELMEHSTRQGNDFAFAGSYSLSKENLITLLAPKYYGATAAADNAYFGKTFVWENSCYMGVIGLMLFLAALGGREKRFTRFWGLVFLAGFVIALGPSTPLFRVFYDYLPGFAAFRGYSKALTVSCLALAILAGKGLDRAAGRPGGTGMTSVSLLVPLVLLGLSAMSLTAPDALPYWKNQLLQQLEVWRLPADPARINTHLGMLRSHLIGMTLFAVSAAGIGWLRGKIPALSKHFASILCLLVFAEFFLYARPYFSPLDFRDSTMPDSLTRPIVDEPAWTRTFHRHPVIANLGLADEVPAVGGFENFTLKEYGKLASYFNSAPLNAKNHYLAIRPTPQNMGFYAADYVLSQGPPPFPMQKIASGGIGGGAPWNLYKNREHSPRYRVVHRIKPFPIGTDEDYRNPNRFAKYARAMLREYTETAFLSPDAYRYVFSQTFGKLQPPNEKERIEVIVEEPDRVILQVDLAGGGVLTVSENFYPGWRGRIDGEAATVFPVNLVMKGLLVPAGKHRVEFYFVPTHFYVTMWASLFSLLTLLGLIGFNPGGQRLYEPPGTDPNAGI